MCRRMARGQSSGPRCHSPTRPCHLRESIFRFPYFSLAIRSRWLGTTFPVTSVRLRHLLAERLARQTDGHFPAGHYLKLPPYLSQKHIAPVNHGSPQTERVANQRRRSRTVDKIDHNRFVGQRLQLERSRVVVAADGCGVDYDVKTFGVEIQQRDIRQAQQLRGERT